MRQDYIPGWVNTRHNSARALQHNKCDYNNCSGVGTPGCKAETVTQPWQDAAWEKFPNALEELRIKLYELFLEMDKDQARTESAGQRENTWIWNRESAYDLISCPAPEVDWDEGTVTEEERM